MVGERGFVSLLPSTGIANNGVFFSFFRHGRIFRSPDRGLIGQRLEQIPLTLMDVFQGRRDPLMAQKNLHLPNLQSLPTNAGQQVRGAPMPE